MVTICWANNFDLAGYLLHNSKIRIYETTILRRAAGTLRTTS